MGEFRGFYHVLHGLWSPMRGRSTDGLKIPELIKRLNERSPKEVILATGSTVEGDATALYLSRILGERNIPTTRLAQGLPKGGELEYADDVTLARALSGRNVLRG